MESKSERSLQLSHTGSIEFPCLPCHIYTHFTIELLIKVKITPTSTIHLDIICFYAGRSQFLYLYDIAKQELGIYLLNIHICMHEVT